MKSTIEIKIRGYHTDAFGHVNHARYLEFMEEGRWDYFETNNLTNAFQKAGLFHVVVNINVDYRKAVLAGETLILETDVKSIGRRKVVVSQQLYLKSTGRLAAEALVTDVFMDKATHKVVPVEDEILNLWPELKQLTLCDCN